MSWLDGLRHRLRVWIHRQEYSEQQAEERRFHREMEAAEGRRGGDAPSVEAYAAVGGPDGEGHPSESSLVERIAQDFRYALRGLARAPGFASVAVLTIALGVGANAAVFSLLDRLFNQPPAGVQDPASLRRLYIEMPGRTMEDGLPMMFPSWSYAAYAAVESAGIGAYDAIAWVPSQEETLRDENREVPVRTSFVSHDYFSVLGVQAALGRVFGDEEAGVRTPAPVAVLGHALWERAYGRDAAVIGRTIRLVDGTFTVIGVAEEGFEGLELDYADVFLPLGAFQASPSSQSVPWYEQTGNYLRAAARLRAGTEDAQASERATAAYLRRSLPASDRRGIDSTQVVLAGPIIETRGPGRRAGVATHLQAISISARTIGVSTMLLLIACANVAALLLVRGNRRRREVAVRLALGVSRGRLAFQLLVEGLTLALIAFAAAIVVATFGSRLLRALLLPDIDWGEGLWEPRTLAFALAAAVTVGLLAGLAPAMQSRRIDLGSCLRSGALPGRQGRSGTLSALIIAQAMLSVVLLVGAALFLRSFGNASALRLGFDVEDVAFVRRLESAPGASDHREAVAAVAERLRASPGVSGVALAMSPPMLGSGMRGVFLRDPGAAVGTLPEARPSYNAVSANYFDVLGARILEGRAFADGEAGVVVVDETMARMYWPGGSALGRCLVFDRPDGPCASVIGVVEDQRGYEVIEEPTLQFFLPLDDGRALPSTPPPRSVVLRIDPRRWNEIVAVARDVTYPRFSERTVRMGRMSDALEAQFRPWRVGAQLFTAFGILALLVTAVGVYGVMAYVVTQRTHEVGVRMALGARLLDVTTLVLRDGLRVVALGGVLGLAAALLLGGLVESFLYGVAPRDPVSALGAAALLLTVGAAASLVPALRAARVDPCEALRQD